LAYFIDLALEVSNGSLEGERQGLLRVGQGLEAVQVFESAVGDFGQGYSSSGPIFPFLIFAETATDDALRGARVRSALMLHLAPT